MRPRLDSRHGTFTDVACRLKTSCCSIRSRHLECMLAAAAVGAVGIAVVSFWRGRTHFRRREQFNSAYRVQVVQGERPAAGQAAPDAFEVVPVVIVVNRGPCTIKGVEAQFSVDDRSLVPGRSNKPVSNFTALPSGLWEQGDTSEEGAMQGILTPWDMGMRFESGEVKVQGLKGHHALVRWTDQWGLRREHRRGEARKIRGNEPWKP